MIVLDTNVVSEFIKPLPDPRVVTWLDAHSQVDLLVTAITKAEMLVGVAILEEGKRRRHLAALVETVLAPFQDALLPFDRDAAGRFSEIVAARRRAGRPIRTMDAQIAAIAAAAGAAVATRDIADFSDIGLDLINPWSD